MPKSSIITQGTAGVDMRVNPLFLQVNRASSATNLTFDENTIKVRHSIEYKELGLKGVFQGSTYYSPSTGLSATSYSNVSTSLANVVGGVVSLNAITGDGVGCKPIVISDKTYTGDTYLFDAENYLIAMNAEANTCWSDSGNFMEDSPGLTASGGDTHDVCETDEVENWLLNCASIGHYINARVHVSVDFGKSNNHGALNSEIWVSDIGGKRSLDDCSAKDILSMEEAMLDSNGGTLVAPSRLGRTTALATLLSTGENGEAVFVDFRENGIVFHDTSQIPRESLYDGDGANTQQGWDEKRISSVQLQTISAVGRYSVYQLPDDLWFRSRYGFHYIKKSLGTGTLRDEKRNHESHDIQPLLDLDEDGPIEGVATGYWLRNDRLMGTVGLIENSMVSSSPMGRGIVVLNQATTYTEDDTPRALWEGLWLLDSDMSGIHKFTKLGERVGDPNFGFIASDKDRNVVAGEFINERRGFDVRGSKERAIKWQYTSGAFAFSGLDTIDSLRSGYVDLVGDASSGDVEIQVKTDQHDCWETWATIDMDFNSRTLKSTSFGTPGDIGVKEATWFQFRIVGSGYIEIRTFNVDTLKENTKNDGRNQCIPVCSQEEDFFELCQ